MSEISFDGESNAINPSPAITTQPSGGIAGWLIKKGLAANQTSADLTLVVLIIIAAAAAVFMLITSYSQPKPSGGAVGDPGYEFPVSDQ